jgi:hypothetical protein
MIGFLFGLAFALPIGVLMGAWAAAIYEERMGREVDRIFLDRKVLGFEPEPWVRKAAGVQVCSCTDFAFSSRSGNISDATGRHFADPDCPFHAGAA